MPALVVSPTRLRVIAAFTWLEALRTRLPWAAVGIAVALFAASVFVRSLALTESERVQIGFLAALLRVAAVFTTCLHVIASMLREAHDKGTELLLSLDITRVEFLCGKAIGYMGVAAGICVILWLPLAAVAPLGPATAWLVSLVLEAWIVVGAALFWVLAFNQLLLSASFVLAFYVLARSIAAVTLIASAEILTDDSASHAVLTGLIKTVALFLPRLDLFTQTGWLLGLGSAWSDLPGLAAQGALYTFVLLAAAAFDLYRKNY